MRATVGIGHLLEPAKIARVQTAGRLIERLPELTFCCSAFPFSLGALALAKMFPPLNGRGQSIFSDVRHDYSTPSFLNRALNVCST